MDDKIRLMNSIRVNAGAGKNAINALLKLFEAVDNVRSDIDVSHCIAIENLTSVINNFTQKAYKKARQLHNEVQITKAK